MPGDGAQGAGPVEVEETLDAIEECHRRGWTDGLPVTPPTADRVAAMLAGGNVPPEQVLGEIPARRRTLTASRAAANAVLGGCLPEHFPVVLAAMAGPVRRHLGIGSTDQPAQLWHQLWHRPVGRPASEDGRLRMADCVRKGSLRRGPRAPGAFVLATLYSWPIANRYLREALSLAT